MADQLPSIDDLDDPLRPGASGGSQQSAPSAQLPDVTPSPLRIATRRRTPWARRILLTLLAGAVLLAVTAPWTLPAIGHWLVVEDTLARSDVLFVHGGHLPFRAIEAAKIFESGMAREVWLLPVAANAERRALEDLGIFQRPGHYWQRQVLERLGVPSSSIRVLDQEVLNTRDEVEAVARELQGRELSSVILVTSKQHSRRVRSLWQRSAPEHLVARVRWSRSDPFDPDSWWKNTEDGSAVIHELAGMIDTWLGGLLRPERASDGGSSVPVPSPSDTPDEPASPSPS